MRESSNLQLQQVLVLSKLDFFTSPMMIIEKLCLAAISRQIIHTPLCADTISSDIVHTFLSSSMSSQKPIQLILARQLASSLAMPIVMVDTQGTLIYCNEPAEALLGLRFDETGEMPAAQWGAQFTVNDEERKPIPNDQWPLVIALTQHKPVSRVIWVGSGGTWRLLNWTSVPLIAQGGEFLGVQSVFWEA